MRPIIKLDPREYYSGDSPALRKVDIFNEGDKSIYIRVSANSITVSDRKPANYGRRTITTFQKEK